MRISLLALYILLYSLSWGQINLAQQLSQYKIQFDDVMEARGYEGFDSEYVIPEMMQDVLNPGEAFLFYHFENDTLSISLIAKDLITSEFVITKKETLQDLELRLKQNYGVHLSRGAAMLDEFVDGENEALNDSICRLLFPKNITTELKNYEYILLIPALNIGSFPLYALQPFEDKNNYLIDEISISLLHSLPNTIKRMKTSNIDFQSHNQALFYPTNPIVVGNPYFGKCQKSYPQIPGAEKEARFIANLYNMPILVGASASKGKVLKQFDQSDFMYFATHGISDASQPMDSGRIVLYDGGSSCDFLSAREIQALSISPECMVVLSACNTGLGKALDAGVIGLARSFMAKGAMNVVMSLWSVDDQATAELMELFALELKEEHPFFPSEHLRQAIIQYKEQNPNPAYWAAFITMGTPYPASLNMSMSSLGKKD